MPRVNPEELRATLVSRQRCVEFLEFAIQQVLQEEARTDPDATPAFLKFLPQFLRITYQQSFDHVFDNAGSEIEKIFLNSLLIAFLKADTLGLIITGPFPNAPEEIRGRQEQFAAVLKVQHDISRSHRSHHTTKDYIDWLERSGQIGRDEAEHWTTLNVMAPLMKEAFHLTPQAGFPDLKVRGRSIRTDAMIWVPVRPSVKYVLECDGYDWHSSKDAFTADRKRDRLLSGEGYSILRFSGHEIYHDPPASAIELFDRLQNIKASWEPTGSDNADRSP